MASEHAEWIEAGATWGPSRHFTRATFDPHGRLIQMDQTGLDRSTARSSYVYDTSGRLAELHWGQADGPISSRHVYSYDAGGRLTRVTRIDEAGERDVETVRYDANGRRTVTMTLPPEQPGGFVWAQSTGSEFAYGAPGAVAVATHYDERGVATGGAFYDDNGRALRVIMLTRDEQGRLIREEARLPADVPDPALPGLPQSMPPDDRATLIQLFNTTFNEMVTTYEYDGRGRLVERRVRMGLLSEERTTFRYAGGDDQTGDDPIGDDPIGDDPIEDDPIEEARETSRRELYVDDDGNLARKDERSDTNHIRFEYTYDTQGNWTERIVAQRSEAGAAFRRTNTERRQLTYY
jgi:YD repeat-containing protein